MSSPEPADPTFDFNQYDIEDSSEEDDGDVLLAMTANKKGKGKAKVYVCQCFYVSLFISQR